MANENEENVNEVQNTENQNVSENSEMPAEDKKNKSSKKGRKIGFSFEKESEKTKSNTPLMIFICVGAFLTMLLACIAIFLVNVKGPEQVLVPTVIGKNLEDALLELQVKELYPKISLRYSDSHSEKGTILEQSPAAGSIVKGYSRISLVVSRGSVVDEVAEYVNRDYKEVCDDIQLLNAGLAEPMITVGEPRFVFNTRPAGTIIEQNPLSGTKISEPVAIEFVVSRGPSYENPKTPVVKGLSLNDMLQQMVTARVIFDFTATQPADGEKPGTVVSQQNLRGRTIAAYSHCSVEIAMPSESVNGTSYGIFTADVDEYPFPVEMSLDVVPANAPEYRLVTFKHTGGNVTIPYAVPDGSTLNFNVAGKLVSSKTLGK